jgi:PAS domain S-box-containing protein
MKNREGKSRSPGINGYRLIFLVVWTCCIAASLAWNIAHQRKAILSLARMRAELTLKKDITYRKWVSSKGGVYVPVSTTEPNPYLKVPDRDIVSREGHYLTLINPAYMTRQVNDMAKEVGFDFGHITSLKPIRPENFPDEWEKKALKDFEKGKKEVFGMDSISGSEYFRFMRPFVVESSCLKCHAVQGYKIGDIRGGISSAIFMRPMYVIERRVRVQLSLAHVIIWILGFAGILFATNRLSAQMEQTRALERQSGIERDRAGSYLNIAAEIILSLDAGGKITLLNDSGYRLLGHEIGTLNGKNWFDTCLPDKERQEIAEYFNKLKQGETDEMIREGLVILKDGTERLILWRNAVLRDDAGRFIGTLSSGEDITERKRAEAVLRGSEKRFRSLFENMLEGFAYCKMLYEDGAPVDFIYLDVNAAFEILTGLKDVAGKKVSEVIPGIRDSDPGLFEIYGRVALTGEPESLEMYVDALKMWFSISVYSPEKEYFVTVFDVITVRKWMEQMLAENEARLRTLVQTIPDLIWLKDPEGVYLSCNPTFERFFGASEEEIVGKTDYDFVDRELADFFREKDRMAMAAGGPSINEEWITFADDGHRALLETIKTPMTDKDGRLIGVLGIARDITERRFAEEALHESDERYRFIADNMTEGIVYTDMGMNIKFITPSVVERSGYTLEELGLIPLERRFTEESYARLMKAASENYAPEKLSDPGCVITIDIELENIRKDGSRYWSGTIFKVIRDAEGHPVGILGVGRDITKRKHAEEHIRLLLSEKELLLKEVHHRIKNNMVMIAGLLKLQASRLSEPGGVKALDESRNRVISMAAMYDLLYRTSDFRYVNVRDYIDRIIDGITKSLPAIAGVTVESQVEDFIMDSKILFPIGIIINELVTNAYKYAFPDGRTGTITVSMSQLPENHVEISVRDNGAGIPESFDINGQTGFGMKLVTLLVKQIEGTLECVRGGGTLFRISFQYTVGEGHAVVADG